MAITDSEINYDNVTKAKQHIENHKWDEAIKLLNAVHKNTEDPDELLEILFYRGLAKDYKRDWEGAIKDYKQALRYADDDNWESILKNNIGLMYSQLCEWTEAINFYHESLQISVERKDAYGSAQTLGNLATIYSIRGEWENALSNYEKCLEIFEDRKDDAGKALTYNNLGLLYYEKGEYNKSEMYFRKSLEIKEKKNDLPKVAQTLNKLGMVIGDIGDW